MQAPSHSLPIFHPRADTAARRIRFIGSRAETRESITRENARRMSHGQKSPIAAIVGPMMIRLWDVRVNFRKESLEPMACKPMA